MAVSLPPLTLSLLLGRSNPSEARIAFGFSCSSSIHLPPLTPSRKGSSLSPTPLCSWGHLRNPYPVLFNKPPREGLTNLATAVGLCAPDFSSCTVQESLEEVRIR
jgi:hypothetical protein